MDYTDVIKDLLSKNITPEKIYQTALDELKKIQAEKERERQKEEKLTKVRDNLVDATVKYLITAFPKTEFGTPDQLAAIIEKALRATEESGGDPLKISFGLGDKDLVKRLKDANEVFDKFLRKNGWGY